MQDVHHLTAQVVAKVAKLASEPLDSPVRLLVRAVPAERHWKVGPCALRGQVVSRARRPDVVAWPARAA